MPPTLRRGNDVGLALDRPGPQQRLPMRLARRNRERGRIDQELGALAAKPKRHLREPEVEADHHAQPAHGSVHRGDDLGSGFDAVALLQDRTAGEVDVEEVEFLVSAGDVAVLVDPDQRVLDFGAAVGGFVDADVDREAGGAGFMLQAEHEGAGGGRLDEGKGLWCG